MSDIGKPLDMSLTMIEHMNELMGDDSTHVSLILDIIPEQNNLRH